MMSFPNNVSITHGQTSPLQNIGRQKSPSSTIQALSLPTYCSSQDMFWQKRPLHSNDELVDELERKRIIRRDSVKQVCNLLVLSQFHYTKVLMHLACQAMKKVDRKNYVLDCDRFAAYYESPQFVFKFPCFSDAATNLIKRLQVHRP